MPPSSAFKVYIRDNSETIEVVTPAKSDTDKVPLGFEKRDRIPRTPVKDEDGNLDSRYTLDGTHLNVAGYLKYLSIVKPLVLPPL